MNTHDASHLLVVEDDPSLAQWVKDYLESHHYQVTLLLSGAGAIDMIRDLKPDLVILDIMLPGKNGFDICKEARQFYQCPILMMTACNDEVDEVLCLELGADDYLIKPVRPRAMLARIQSLLRRAKPMGAGTELNCGSLLLDSTQKVVLKGGTKLPVSNNEFDVLWSLILHAGQVVSRADLVSELRGFDYDGFDRSIDIRISRLRKKLADAKAEVSITTIWGKGYLLKPE